jgi:hypothetical protein
MKKKNARLARADNRDKEQTLDNFSLRCTCHDQVFLPLTSRQVRAVTDLVIADINNRTSSFRACARLNLLEITHAVQSKANDQILSFSKKQNDVLNSRLFFGPRAKARINFLVSFVTFPGDAHFEATVVVDEAGGGATVAGDISRINEYASQSACVQNSGLKKFCYCDSSGFGDATG